ncbi:Serine/Threonine-kinase TTK/MPS1 [Rhizoctonia solani AG-3 Rhs1AP]|uniref:Serine/Threonine-kinase TTK/MPS1 n=1 Tax=Rhizoctonia solani AG-3 Rhs1AP TaxID=1086054 RepID=X8IYH8_9AGAM|nr:Serine/Threonine-kinase TTK/MPS1 [Rhizoctonia solani AG-3 Rhs1AP]
MLDATIILASATRSVAMLSSHPAGLPPPVSPFRPNLDALKLDISDDEDGLEVDPQINKLLSHSNAASPGLSVLGASELDTPQDLPDDSLRLSPRPRAASTLAQSASMHATLPPITTNRQFLRTASQPASVFGVSPTMEQYSPDGLAPPRTGSLKRTLVPSASRIAPPRPISEATPLNTRKPLLSASAHTGKFISRPGNGRISPPRRVLVKDQPADEPETEEEEQQQVPYSIAPRATDRLHILRPKTTPEHPGRLLGRSMSSPDAGLRQLPISPIPVSPIDSPIAEPHPPTPPEQPHPLATSSVLAKTSTSSLASTASSLRGGVGSVKARLQDWKSSLGSWSKSTRSRPPIPGRQSSESVQPKPSIDSLRESLRQSFDRPSLDTVRPGLDPDSQPDHEQTDDDRGYAGRGYEPPPPRSISSAGWNERPGTSSGYYAQPQVKSVQNHHEHVRRTSETLRPSPLDTPPSNKSPLSSLRHKRSPTAPSPPTSTIIAREKENRGGQAWQERERERSDPIDYGREDGKILERERERLREVENRNRGDMRDSRGEMDRDGRPASSLGLPPGTAPREGALPAKRDRFICNKQEYTVVDCIGRGGSSKVYKVISPTNKIYALKRVRLDSKVDEETMRGYVNEMQLLKRLDGNERIIKLIDSQAVGRGGRYLMMVMELGEIDLAKLLAEKQGTRLQPHWIAIYWQQMLEAVQTIHDEKIVHSDLKPANFVLVKGSLKLIDFGIAKAIANDTTNIQREHQVGTLNYMSPESIEETQTANGRRLKLGRASDVWSLGCILYQMIYGRPPFYSITGAVPKLRAISDPNHIIDYPADSIPTTPATDKEGPRQIVDWATPVPLDVIDTLRGCLTRDPKQRKTIPELLDDPWLRSWTHTTAPPPEMPKLRESEAIVTEAWLKQIIEHASKEAIENGALDEEAVQQMAQNLLPALRLANTKHPAYSKFC